MQPHGISLVVALSENSAIGIDNQLPWHLPADLRHFRDLTMDKPILMGRRTYDSIGRALPGRHNIVLSRDRSLVIEGCTVVPDLDAALRAAGAVDELMVIGGARVYEMTLPLASRLYLTRIHAMVDGDTFFPDIPAEDWRESSRESFRDEATRLDYSFVVMERRGQPGRPGA
jgi:dihydrofolate reductase